jgi:hypothetical protein
MAAGRRPTALERRRQQSRVIAVVVAVAMVALIAIPFLGMLV